MLIYSHHDLQQMNLKPHLHPIEDGKTDLPAAPYILPLEKKSTLLQFKELKVLDSF